VVLQIPKHFIIHTARKCIAVMEVSVEPDGPAGTGDSWKAQK
jgi:hypothetical protein